MSGLTVKTDRDGFRTYYQHDERGGNRGGKRWKKNFQKNRNFDDYSGRNDNSKRGGKFDRDEDVSMSDEVQKDGRFTPYGRGQWRGKNRGGKNFSQGPTRQREYQGNREQWWKILIPHGKKMEKDFILKSIGDLCDLPFIPFNYQTEGAASVFYVDDYNLANAIGKVNMKIYTPLGTKMMIRSNACGQPPIQIDAVLKEKLKIIMSKRYNTDTKCLDLSNFSQDPDLRQEGLYLPLTKTPVVANIVNIIKEHIPQICGLNLSNNKLHYLDLSSLVGKTLDLKSIHLGNNNLRNINDIDKLKGLPVDEIYLDGNLLCDNYVDNQEGYISAIRARFPKVTKVDGVVLPSQIGFDLDDDSTAVPVSQGSFFMNDIAKSVGVEFIKQYFLIYDSADRQGLLAAYKDQAVFSYSCVRPQKGVSMSEFIQDSRNLLRVPEPGRRNRLIQEGKINVVSFLSRLPRTQHDLASFVVDTSFSSNVMISFTITGLYKEIGSPNNKGRFVIRAFSRVFLIVPVDSGYCIINDTLCISNPTPEQSRDAFRQPAAAPSTQIEVPSTSSLPGVVSLPVLETPTPANTPTPIPDPLQLQQMVIAFAQKSGMKEEWATKCLQECDWDFDKAAVNFKLFHESGLIPPDAYSGLPPTL